MPRTKISEFSATAGSNTDIDGINIAEGCSPSGINDAIRELMSQLKDFQAGTAGDSFNGPVGTTTAAAGAFTTLSASSTVSGTGFSTYLASPPAIGGTAAAAGSFTTLSASSLATLSAGASIQGLTVGRGAGAVSTNTAVGASALAANTSGSANAAFGSEALYNVTTGAGNTAVGYQAIRGSGGGVTGNYNVGIGQGTFNALSTGSSNIGIGYQALTSNTTASNNTAVGYQAGYSNTTGAQNTLVGIYAGYSLTTGSGNTFVGSHAVGGGAAGSLVTTGSKNTILGKYNGNEGGLDIRTASNYIVLSDGDGNPRGIFDANGTLLIGTTVRNTIVGSSCKFQATNAGQDYAALLENTNATAAYGLLIKYTAVSPNGIGSSFIYCDDGGGTQRFSVRSNGGVYNYQANDTNLSDRREKTNFAPAKSYLDTICAIPVQTFNYIDQSEDDPGLTLGVVAQDVQAVAPELVMESNWGTKDDPKMRLSIYQTDLQYALMKCIQELKSELDTVKAELATLKGA